MYKVQDLLHEIAYYQAEIDHAMINEDSTMEEIELYKEKVLELELELKEALLDQEEEGMVL